jgi:hypothetical protein
MVSMLQITTTLSYAGGNAAQAVAELKFQSF